VHIFKVYIRTLVSFVFLLSMVSCGGIQKDLKLRAKRVPEQIKETKDLLEKFRKDYEQFKQTDEFQYEFKTYAGSDRENWEANFSKADEELSHTREFYEINVIATLKRNNKEDELELGRQLKSIDSKIQHCRKLAQKTSLRITELHNAKENAAEMIKGSGEITDQTNKIFQGLESVVIKSQANYPNKKQDFDSRFSWFVTLHNDSNHALETAKNEFSSNKPDYARFADSCTLIANNLDAIKKNDMKLRAKIIELGKDYSKILRDMKIEQKPWVEEVKYEWNNWSDWDTTQEVYRRKRYVSMDVYDRVNKRVGEEGGMISRGSSYEVWIEDLDIEEKYFHRYLIVENDEQQMGEWEEVQEKFYEANEDNLNMSIVTKPFGFYEDEVMKVATPPGYDKVGDPRYGKWVENRVSGEREWSFFQKYLFWSMILNGIGPRHHYYSYGRWNDWNRNYRGRRPYYGIGGGDFGSYGRSTKTNSHMRDTTFSKSGGFKEAKPSIREAGRGTRGRGPGRGK